jgi:hypothetical protein
MNALGIGKVRRVALREVWKHEAYARPAARPCHAMRRERARFDGDAVPAVRPARNAKMVGWLNGAAAMASFLAVFGIRHVPRKGSPRSNRVSNRP